MKLEDCIVPDWPAPPNVRALITTRAGGVSAGPYANMNPADHVADDPLAVAQNRALLRALLPNEPHWLKQVHGTAVCRVPGPTPAGAVPPEADASITDVPAAVCVVLTADCLPVLLCDAAGTVVGAAHAGWRGLCAGVIEATVETMGVPGSQLVAYLGPAIGPKAFEVGDDVRAAFLAVDAAAEAAFAPYCAGMLNPAPGTQKWLADINLLARQRLAKMGVTRIFGGGDCTFTDSRRFFSYRRDGATGRMASLVWLAGSPTASRIMARFA
jgi:YfiH family protein